MSKENKSEDILHEVKTEIVNEYLKNVTVTDVSIEDTFFGETIYINITDRNRKHFKNKIISYEVLCVENKSQLEKYVDKAIVDYVLSVSGIRKKISNKKNKIIIDEYKSDNK